MKSSKVVGLVGKLLILTGIGAAITAGTMKKEYQKKEVEVNVPEPVKEDTDEYEQESCQ